jgi:hypothetical protein
MTSSWRATVQTEGFSRRLAAGLFLTSLTLLALELVLVRIFSVLMWYHFVSLVVSLALFGLTVSGIAVFLFPGAFPAAKARERMGLSSLFLAAAVLANWLFLFVLSRNPLAAYKVLAPFHQPFYEPFGPAAAGGGLSLATAAPLALIFIVSSLPFLAGGFTVTVAIFRYSGSIGRVYFADLAGAGAGSAGAVVLLSLVDPFTGLGILAAAAALSALFFFTSRGGRLAALAVLLVAAGTAAATWQKGLVELNFIRGRYEPEILSREWNSFSRVAVYPLRGGQAGGSWGLSRIYRKPVPDQLGIVVDDTGYTSMIAHEPGAQADWAGWTLFGLPYLIRDKADALIIGPGGGKEIVVALSLGAERVTAVELNPLMVRAVNETFADFSGSPYSLPGVRKVIDEGRTFLRGDEGTYDIIQATVVYGRLAPSAGAFTLTEDHLYTVEAFGDYLDRLDEDGMLAFSRFVFEKRIQRMVATAEEALLRRGVKDPENRIFIAAERGMATVLVKKSPFTAAEVAALEDHCRHSGFRVLYSPAGEGGNPFYSLLRAEDREGYFGSLAYDISPVTDDRPFFYYLVRPRDFVRAFAGFRGPDFDDRALLLIRNLLLVVSALVVVFFGLPLLLRGERGAAVRRGGLPALVFFASIGLGFIVVEIVLLKRFILLLGKPFYSAALVLSSFLVAGGIGSLRAGGRPAGGEALRRRCGALTVALLFTALLLPLLVELTLHLPLPLRLAAAVAVTVPLGYLMGQPFPLAVSLLRRRREGLIPWVWGVNGALSVLGAMLALVLALNLGYTTTMFVGSASYLVAAVCAEDLA